MRLFKLPPLMWWYGGLGAVLIIWSGFKIVFARPSKR
jgi:hypothetical protein